MPLTDTKSTTRRYGLTLLGRVRAVLIELERRWPTLTDVDKAEALRLVDERAGCYRRANCQAGVTTPRAAVPPVGRITA